MAFPQHRRPGCITLLRAIVFVGGLLAAGVTGAEETSPPPLEYEPTSRVLIAPSLPFYSAAVSPDGAWIATGHVDGAILVWDVAEARPLRRLSGHSETVEALAFHPSEPKLASAGSDCTVRAWDVATGAAIQVLAGHERRVTTVVFSPDGRSLLSGSYDKSARLWSLEAPATAPRVFEHSSAVCSAAFSSDGKQIATGTLSGELRRWSVEGEAAPPVIQAHRGELGAIVFHPTARQWITGGADGQAIAWDAATGEERRRFLDAGSRVTGPSPITRLSLNSDGNLLAIGERGGGIQLCTPLETRAIDTLSTHTDEIATLVFQASSSTLISAGLDRTVRLWRPKLRATARLAALEGSKARLWSLAMAGDDTRLFAGGRGGFLASWSLATGELGPKIAGFPGVVDAIALSPDGTRLACCGWTGKSTTIFEIATGRILQTLAADTPTRSVCFHPNGRQLAVGLGDGTIQIWVDGVDRPLTRSMGSQAVHDIAFSPDGKQAVTCAGDWRQPVPGAIVFWNAETWSEIAKVTEHTRAVRAVAFSADGMRLASAGDDGLVILWHPESRIPLARLENGSGARPIAFAPDGSQLAVGLHDGTIHVWDVARQELLQRFRAEDDVFQLAYTKDGSVLASVSGEKHVELWPVGPLQGTARRIVDRSSSRSESSPGLEGNGNVPSANVPSK